MGSPLPLMAQLTEKGLQQVAGWPGSADDRAVSRLLAAIDSEFEQTQDPDRRGRLATLRHAAGDVGKEVLGEVLAKVLTQGT